MSDYYWPTKRFRITEGNLKDCIEHFDFPTIQPEEKAKKRLVEACRKVCEKQGYEVKDSQGMGGGEKT